MRSVELFEAANCTFCETIEDAGCVVKASLLSLALYQYSSGLVICQVVFLTAERGELVDSGTCS